MVLRRREVLVVLAVHVGAATVLMPVAAGATQPMFLAQAAAVLAALP